MKYVFILVIFLCAGITAAYSQPGTLDKSFGDGGIVMGKTYYGGYNDLIIQKDGKIISVGAGGYGKFPSGFLVVRYNMDGTPDLSFGDSGRAATPYGGGVSYGVLQADGKIVVAGVVGRVGDGNNLAVVRFNANGDGIDSSFGANGLIVEALTKQYDNPCGIVVQPDGKIVVAGATVDLSDYDAVAPTIYLIRYNENGSHDESFGKNGIYQEEAGAFDVAGLILQPDGKLLVGGDDYGVSGFPFFVRRYTKNGAPDVEFGVKGEARYFCENADYGSTLNTIALQPDGKIVVAGSTYISNFIGNATVVRFNADGSTDNEFGKKGSVTTAPGSNTGLDIKEIAIQTNGKIIAGGHTYDGYPFTYSNFASLQYTSDGSIDSSYGTNGIQITMLKGKTSTASLALQKDGKFILGGNLYNPSDIVPNHTVFARYNGDNTKQPLAIRIKRWMLHHGISWQMQPTKNVRYYAIQRSADGIIYKEIAKLSNKQQVDKYEDAAITGSSYYRLAAIGWDGSRTYSNTVLIDESAQVKLFPNPVRDNLQLQGLATGKTSVSIVDLGGNVRSSSIAGGATYSVNTSQLTPGNYLLKLQHNSTTTTQPFVKE